MPSLLLATLLSLAPMGCFGGLDLACKQDPHDWWDNPTYTMMHADSEGRFDFDPIDEPTSRRDGRYNLHNGNYSWVDLYESRYYLDRTEVDGYGTIADNGNLDILHTEKTTDILGVVSNWLVRIERTKCEGTTTHTEVATDATWESTPADDALSYVTSWDIQSDGKVRGHMEMDRDYGRWVQDTVCTPDVQSRVSVDYADGSYLSSSTYQYDGTGTSEWSQYASLDNSDYDFIGTDRYRFDGGYVQEYGVYPAGTSNAAAEIYLDMNYDGSGTGTYTIHDGGETITCDLTMTSDGGCTMDCPDGRYDC